MCRGGCVAALLKLESQLERLCRSNSSMKKCRLRETHKHTHTYPHTPSGPMYCRAATRPGMHTLPGVSVRAELEDSLAHWSAWKVNHNTDRTFVQLTSFLLCLLQVRIYQYISRVIGQKLWTNLFVYVCVVVLPASVLLLLLAACVCDLAKK